VENLEVAELDRPGTSGSLRGAGQFAVRCECFITGESATEAEAATEFRMSYRRRGLVIEIRYPAGSRADRKSRVRTLLSRTARNSHRYARARASHEGSKLARREPA